MREIQPNPMREIQPNPMREIQPNPIREIELVDNFSQICFKPN